MFKSKDQIIYGYHPVLEAVQRNVSIDKVLFAKNLSRSKYEEIMYLCRQKNIPVQFVPKEKLAKITNLNHQGIIALNALIDYADIEQIIPFIYEQGKTPLILVLDGVTDVRNFGSIARSAECAGVDAIIISLRGSAQINSEAIKASAGALNKIPVCRVDSMVSTVQYLKEAGLAIFAISEKGDKAYFEEDFDKPLAMIMGDEENGIGDDLLHLADDALLIPMKGQIQSLNVSVAAGIILFEILKKQTR
jgi:23S rRNA (guanosine2251-2'-O)-methyltransferase